MSRGPTSPGYASLACSALLSPLHTGITARGGRPALLAPRPIFAPALPAHGMTPGALAALAIRRMRTRATSPWDRRSP